MSMRLRPLYQPLSKALSTAGPTLQMYSLQLQRLCNHLWNRDRSKHVHLQPLEKRAAEHQLCEYLFIP